MYRLLLILSLSIFLLFRNDFLEAQITGTRNLNIITDTEKDSVSALAETDTTFESSISPFAELLGKGFFSLNVDFRIKKHFAISFGLQPMEVVCPDIMFYYLSGEKKSFEIGGGLSTAMTSKMDLGGLLIHGVIGYRYQKKKGVFFRAGFTPIYVIPVNSEDVKKRLLPFIGLSLGYSY